MWTWWWSWVMIGSGKTRSLKHLLKHINPRGFLSGGYILKGKSIKGWYFFGD